MRVIQPLNDIKVPVKIWDGPNVGMDENTIEQITNVAKLPFVHHHVALMPDGHFGIGATVGSVIPMIGAIVPAAVGVDIGCGMIAVKTSLRADQLPDNLKDLRSLIEKKVPHGKEWGNRDPGAWHDPPNDVLFAWQNKLIVPWRLLVNDYPKLDKNAPPPNHLGTLGTGNHFIELCLDQNNDVWVMLHSGSRGPGNRIGQLFIELAKKEMERWFIHLPDKDLAYFPEGSDYYEEYIFAMNFAQGYARLNREIMLRRVVEALKETFPTLDVTLSTEAINCHHNYISYEYHFGKRVNLIRKGAIDAHEGVLGIIPGSMGAKSFIVKGKGNPESFHSCSHGAGRKMSRKEAKRRFTVEDQIEQTQGVECKKDASVIDEIPSAYKSIDAVMKAQEDLVDVIYTLKQILCVKG